jgi:hypothetical protein
MRARRIAIAEEAVAEVLLEDLKIIGGAEHAGISPAPPAAGTVLHD